MQLMQLKHGMAILSRLTLILLLTHQIKNSMKKLNSLKKTFLSLLCLLVLTAAHAQTDTSKVKTYVITTNDGGEFIGEIISQDAKEVLIQTKDKGQVSIPKYQVKEIREIKDGDINTGGVYIPDEVFSTRYFITTNGLPIKKGESYILWNLWGPDFQFGVADNLSVGVMTSWLAYPLVATAKYSIPVNDKVNIGVGLLAGTSTWGSGSFFFGFALPFGSVTFGDRKSNLTFSGGYGAVAFEGESSGRPLVSVSGMSKVGKKVSLVFDSFILPPNSGNGSGGGLLIPGIRLQTAEDKAFQFGFAGIFADGEALPVPIPFVQWFKKI